jgi:hypothetical protein
MVGQSRRHSEITPLASGTTHGDPASYQINLGVCVPMAIISSRRLYILKFVHICIFYTCHKRKEDGHFASKLNIRVISIVSFEVKYAVLIAIVRRIQESSKESRMDDRRL